MAELVWGWKAHEAQKGPWLSEAANKVLVCGRRWGKTVSGAMDDLTCLLTIPGWQGMVIAPSRDQVIINYKEVLRLLGEVGDFKGIYSAKVTPHPEIVIRDGVTERSIIYRTAGDDGKYIRGHGKGLKRIRIDEAAYVKQSTLEGAVEMMSLDAGAQLILQGTPFGKNHFFKRYNAGLVGDSSYDGVTESFHSPTIANPHLQLPVYERLKKSLGEDSLRWRCEYLAEFVDSAGSVFPWELIESCLYDRNPETTYEVYIAGIDLARYSDYTVVSIGGFDRGMVKVCDMDRFNEVDWTVQKARIYDTMQRYKAVGAIDATSIGDEPTDDLIVGEYVDMGEEGRVRKRPGIPLEKVKITHNSVKRELIDKLKVRMSQGLVKIPFPSADPETGDDKWNLMVDELKYFGYTLTEFGSVKFAAEGDYHDDIVISLALLIKRAFGQFEARQVVNTYPPETFGWVCEEIDRARAQGERMVIGSA